MPNDILFLLIFLVCAFLTVFWWVQAIFFARTEIPSLTMQEFQMTSIRQSIFSETDHVFSHSFFGVHSTKDKMKGMRCILCHAAYSSAEI